MLAYLLRLDDACPNMDAAAWERVERILDQYGIKPIVGIIPQCEDPKLNGRYPPIVDFWSSDAHRFQDKGWIIAQHGCYHKYLPEKHTEFAGLSYEEQEQLIITGNKILRDHGIVPTCFFAPSHSFDDTTVDVIRESGLFQFVSDGYAFSTFLYRKMLFLPSLFNTPHKIFNFGVYTFVLHPNIMKERDFTALEAFLSKHRMLFKTLNEILPLIDTSRQRNIFEHGIECGIKAVRAGRKLLKSHGR